MDLALRFTLIKYIYVCIYIYIYICVCVGVGEGVGVCACVCDCGVCVLLNQAKLFVGKFSYVVASKLLYKYFLCISLQTHTHTHIYKSTSWG